MADAADQPAQQTEPDYRDQVVVRLDVGGWISGPCLNAEELDLSAGWLADLGPAEPAPVRQRPTQ